MKNITVIIDRVSGSNIPTAKAEIEEVLEALKPLRERGLRVRVCRSHLTLKEDMPWRAKAAGAAVFSDPRASAAGEKYRANVLGNSLAFRTYSPVPSALQISELIT